MNQALGKFEVCCKAPPTFETPAETAETAGTAETLPVSAAQSPAMSQQQAPGPSSSAAAVPAAAPAAVPAAAPAAAPAPRCPAPGPLPPLSVCAGRQSNCWSVGVRDLDCLDSALCCFDGCANVCMGRGERQQTKHH